MKASWASGFQQLAAAQTGAEVTALHAMHPSRVDGLALFALAGDAKGVLQFLSPEGELTATHDTGLSPSSTQTKYVLSDLRLLKCT